MLKAAAKKEEGKDEKTFWERVNESSENQKRLVANTEYFDWLYEFTKSHRKFFDTDWLYDRVSISENDYSQVERLTDFFTAIDRYHRDNLLEPNIDGYEWWYNIKYKDAYFAINVMVGQGATNFAIRYDSYEGVVHEPFIDFEYILQGKPVPELEQKQSKLQDFANIVREMKEMGIPLSVIVERVTKTFAQKD